ncbi:YncE family protein [Cellulomonas sp. URHD0024]|uniref:YncE family protein n=1 Tax=Cellulomonas sp. URHD0024 TaxID=1302620 RepID=UPI00040B8A2E|nr:YncE family protein [Cellulomonas sp. URHD0024]
MADRRLRTALAVCAVALVAVGVAPAPSVAAPGPTIPVGDRPLGVAFSPDSSRAYVANADGNSLSVIDTATGTVVDMIATSPKPFDVTVSPDGTRVYASAIGEGPIPGSLDIVDPSTGTVSPQLGPLGNPSGIAADASFVYVTNATGQFTRFPAAGGAAQGCELQTPTRGVALAHGTAYATLYDLNGVQAVDTATFTCAAPPPPPPPTVTVDNNPWGIVYNPVRDELYVGNSGTPSVSVIDPNTNTVTRTLPVGPGSRALAVSPDGDRLYITNSTPSLQVVNFANPLRSGIALVDPSSEGVDASPDGRLVYVTDAANDTVIPFERPTVTAPVDVSLVEGEAATFSVTTTGDVTDVTWETSRDGATWTPVPDVSGTTLTLNPVLADSGLQVRAVVHSVVFEWTTSESALLTVTAVPTPTPTPTQTPTPTSTATPAVPAVPEGGELSATGSTSGPLAGLALGLVVLGAGAFLLARRRRA